MRVGSPSTSCGFPFPILIGRTDCTVANTYRYFGVLVFLAVLERVLAAFFRWRSTRVLALLLHLRNIRTLSFETHVVYIFHTINCRAGIVMMWIHDI